MTDNEWLSSLKDGDKVAVEHNYYGTKSYTIVTIEKITPTRQIKVSGYLEKFRDGRLPRGDSRMSMGISDCLVKITDEVLEAGIRLELLNYISKIKFNSLSTEKLKQIKDIIKL